MGLSQPEIDLGFIASRLRTQKDESLDRLLILARAVGVSITLVVDGLLITGLLSHDLAWGQRLDEVLEENADDLVPGLVNAGWDLEAAERVAKTMREQTYSKAVEEREREHTEHFKKLEAAGATSEDDPVPLRELDEELARDEIEQRGRGYPTITLTNARVLTEATGWIEIGMMRVLTSHVSAWWPGLTS